VENRKVVEPRPIETVSSVRFGSENMVYVADQSNDEINLGELISNIISEWKSIALVLIIGSLLSVVSSLVLTKSYVVDAIIRLPNVNELGSISDQELLEITPEKALGIFVDHLTEPEIQVEVFEQSSLFETLSKDSQMTSSQIFSGIRKKLSVSRVKHQYYELEKSEKTPFKEVNISLLSSEPKLAAEYIEALIKRAHVEAIAELTDDIVWTKRNRIRAINDQLHSLTLATAASRNAEIKRLEEKNRELVSGLQKQILLQIKKAKRDRENRIVQVEEALATAKDLDIIDPVTWDDLRTNRKNSQITNEFGGTDETAPRYFQGTRILSAELNRLKSRQNDKPFIKDLVDLEKKIEELENDPKIDALKSRQDDTIYIEKFDELHQELSRLIQTPVSFENSNLALVTQNAVVAPGPTRNPVLIILTGVFISGFVGILFALVRVSIRNKD